jgi:hypothetical protein
MSRCATTGEGTAALPWRVGAPLRPERYRHVLRRAIFDCCKWHLQVEDRPVLCAFPLIIEPLTWDRLARQAEELAREALAAERELLDRPDLHADLGLPYPLRRLLRQSASAAIASDAVRVMRFDFHWTTEGWRISEANTDVAGGYIEASGVTRLMAGEYTGCVPAGDPAGALGSALRRRVGAGGTVGLFHLTVYADDGEIMHYLAGRLAEQEITPILFGPAQGCSGATRPMDLVFRFLPAEWLPRLPWRPRIDLPMCNPVHAVLSQSKRFPLVWDRLATPLPTWRALLPATRAPRRFDRCDTNGWVLKPALGHEGHDIGIQGVTDEGHWRQIRRRAWWNPGAWSLQLRFTPLALPTPDGPLYPCLGIYVIDGQPAGAFGRVAERPLIDDRSREVVVLLSPSAVEDAPHATRASL